MRANEEWKGGGKSERALLSRRRCNDEQGRPCSHPRYAPVKTAARVEEQKRRWPASNHANVSYRRLPHELSRRQTKRICKQHHSSLFFFFLFCRKSTVHTTRRYKGGRQRRLARNKFSIFCLAALCKLTARQAATIPEAGELFRGRRRSHNFHIARASWDLPFESPHFFSTSHAPSAGPISSRRCHAASSAKARSRFLHRRARRDRRRRLPAADDNVTLAGGEKKKKKRGRARVNPERHTHTRTRAHEEREKASGRSFSKNGAAASRISRAR